MPHPQAQCRYRKRDEVSPILLRYGQEALNVVQEAVQAIIDVTVLFKELVDLSQPFCWDPSPATVEICKIRIFFKGNEAQDYRVQQIAKRKQSFDDPGALRSR